MKNYQEQIKFEREVAEHVKNFDLEIKNKQGHCPEINVTCIDEIFSGVVKVITKKQSEIKKYLKQEHHYKVRRKLEKLDDAITRSLDDIRRSMLDDEILI